MSLANADATRDRRQWRKAAAAYRRYLTIEPRKFGAWVQLGHVLKEDGDFSGATGAYAEAFKIKADDSDLLLSLGHLAKLQGDVPSAIKHYRASVHIDQNPHAVAELARLTHEPAATAGGIALGRPVESGARASNHGRIDSVQGTLVRGWAVDPMHPDRPAVIEFVNAAGQAIGTAVASLARPDLQAVGLSADSAGFETVLPLDAGSGESVVIHARLQRTGLELTSSPFLVSQDRRRAVVRPPRVTDAHFAIAKPFVCTAVEVALFVTHAPDGVVKPHVRPYLEALNRGGVAVLLIVMVDRPLLVSDAIDALTAGIMVRQNIGYDFAGWAHAIRIFPEVYASSILYLVNDSMFGPNTDEGLADILSNIRADGADLISLTETHEHEWHLQSYFLAFKQTLLSSYAFQAFINNISMLRSKEEVIRSYEIPFASRMEAAGFSTKTLFSVGEPRNATMHGWRELLLTGFPFVKTLLFRQKFAEIDMTNWRSLVEDAGFNVPLLEMTLKHRGVTGPVAPNFPLLAKPIANNAANARPTGPLKVALYGPWNYDNGLGLACQGLIAALRRIDIRLNLHPIKKAFHIHRLVVSPHDILDFEGDADVAIVHLNPDSWVLLTDEQRAAVARAKKRIGYWVWEMGHIPAAWRQDFSSVDRIWAASGYNAALFAAQNEAPVDIIPHPVQVPVERSNPCPKAVAARLNVPSGRKLILYIFDGSSYLVRKNPAALVRAFAASGLNTRGWTLVLKTKHLHDRPEEGAAFAELVERTPDVCLIDRPLPLRDLTDLMAAADIYASPHCSEGFGLTVAEAMAFGKPVVATDFSGTTQFLDGSCGYPVPAQPYVLEEDYGHYTKGGTWGRIDENALAEALKHAARDVEANDRRIADAARTRVRDMLSYESIGALIEKSLDALWEQSERPTSKSMPSLPATIHGGIPALSAQLGQNFVVCALNLGDPDADATHEVPNSPDRWAVFAPADSLLSPDFASIVTSMIGRRPDVSIFYGDDVAMGEDTILNQLRYKPEFDVSLFVAQDVIGMPLIVRGSSLHTLGGLDAGAGEAMLVDLTLRAHAAGLSIARISEVLLAVTGKRKRVATAARQAVFSKCATFSDYELRDGLTPETLQLARTFDAYPDVTLLVPTCHATDDLGKSYLNRLLGSLAKTDWPVDRLRVLVGDDQASDVDWRCAFRVDRLATPRPAGEPFNYAAKMNTLWRAATTEHVIFMNDDVLVTEPGWLKALMTFAVDQQIGGVGPRLLYDDGRIQHAGVPGGLFGVAAHAWLGRASSLGSYQDWILTHREWSMLTGAVFATRRAVLAQVDGFDERFTLEYNDLDLCLRIRANGLRLVYTPFATLTHSEKASRGTTAVAAEQMALFLRRWHSWLDNDPSFHPLLRRDRFDLEPSIRSSEWFV